MVHRDFRGSARNSLASRPSSHEKHLENFFTIFSLNVLTTCPGNLLATHPNREKRVFGKKWVNLKKKTFSVFPWTFYDYSLSLSTETHPNTPCHSLQTPFLHLFTSKSSRKRYGFLFPHLISHVLSFIFMNICVDVFFFCYGFVSFFLDCPCLDCWGIVPMWTCFG